MSDLKIEALALPFTFGMAIGLATGRMVIGSTLIGLLLGVVLFGLLAAVRTLIVP